MVNAENTAKEHFEQSGRMRHLVVKSVLFKYEREKIPIYFSFSNY